MTDLFKGLKPELPSIEPEIYLLDIEEVNASSNDRRRVS